DGTAFNLSAGARMVLNEFVYSPNGSANASVINLVQGSFTFVAGKIAHTGDMKVGTPVGIMGIRGTVVNVTVKADNGAADISVMAQGDNLLHSVEVWAQPSAADIAAGRSVGVLLGTVTSVGGLFTFTPTPTGILVQETGKDAATIQAELAIVQQVFQTQSVGEAILAQQPLPYSNGNTPGTQITTTFPTELSTTQIVVTTTTTGGQTTVTGVQTVPPPEGSPPTVPLNQPVTDQTNHSPVVAHQIADQASPEDQAWSFQVPSDTFSDAHSDALTLTATLANGDPLPAWLTFNSETNTFSGTPPLNFDGVIEIKVTASDGTLTQSDTFQLTVTPVNDAPVIHAPCEGIVYWASNTSGNVTVINHISFDDVDAGGAPV